ncbi:centrosomal protein of 19 kDa-like [Thrips palmi]|uniref:Centrosomal protein of 19 kDa n=1 Tax=Thrips palmi TaxID=161013 RepID=A0A6P8YZM6_THRPL|nr:centrosomal protein of 19 kDa-like [Thrips palmi]
MSEITQKMRKLGIRFDPPSLVLIYSNDKMKLHQRVMPVRNFNAGSNVNFFATQLKQRHEEFLHSVPLISIEKMLRILQEHIRGSPLESILKNINSEYEINPDEDLNKLTDDQLHRKKLIMEASFVANQLQPSDPDYEYDRQVDFEDNKIESGWDSESNAKETETDDFWG